MRTLVVSLNPAVDAEWRVPQVHWEERNNIVEERRWAGGKGSNVARWTRHLGGQPLLVLPLGGPAGDELAGYLAAASIPIGRVPIGQPTRVNVFITTERQGQMRFNPLGPKLSSPEWKSVFESVESQLASSSMLVLSGSLPRRAPVTTYANLLRAGSRAGVVTVLDCDGDAFSAGIRSRPFLVKPNHYELELWHGGRLRGEKAVLKAALALSKETRGWVLVSLGGDGAMLVNEAEGIACSARPPKIEIVNTVGAGDALLAAVCRQISKQAVPSEWLAWGVATGTGAASVPGGALPSKKLLARLRAEIQVRDLLSA